MDRYILTCPGRKPIKHEGFELFVNKGYHAHAWMRCAKGHLDLLSRGDEACVILEDDVRLCPDFETRLQRLLGVLPANGIGMLYVAIDVGLPVREIPMVYPPEMHDWGTQGTVYTPLMRKVCRSLIQAYLGLPVATVIRDYRIPEKERPRATMDGVGDGFDVVMYKALRLLQCPVVCFPMVQHMCAKSTCLSTPHISPFFPKPKEIKKLEGWL